MFPIPPPVSWENIDAVNWRFRLRPGITFSNGEKFDARPLVPRCKTRGSGETDPVIRRRGFEERRSAVALKTRRDRFFGGQRCVAGYWRLQDCPLLAEAVEEQLLN